MVLLLVCATSATPLVHADSGANATLGGNVSASDNAFASASGEKQADIYWQIRPGALFGYETPRAVYTALVEAEATDYIDHNDQAAFSVRANGHATFVTSPTSALDLAATVSTGKLNALAGRSTPDQTGTQLVAIGSGNIYSVGGTQGYSSQLAQNVRFSQSAAVNYVETDTGSATSRATQGSVGIGMTKSTDGNAFTVEVGATLVRFLTYDPGDAMRPATGRLDHELDPRASMGWRHDLSRAWSTSLTAGLQALVPYGEDRYNPTRTELKTSVSPMASAQLSYVDTWGYANVVVTHGLAPNLTLAQNTTTDSAALNAAIPLAMFESHGRPPRLTASGSIGYFRSTLEDTRTNADLGTFSGEHVDVGVAYLPRPNQIYGLRYSLAHQTGSATAGAMTASLTTNTISFTFSLRYPDRIQVRERKASVRADESDTKAVDDKRSDADIDSDTGGTTKRSD